MSQTRPRHGFWGLAPAGTSPAKSPVTIDHPVKYSLAAGRIPQQVGSAQRWCLDDGNPSSVGLYFGTTFQRRVPRRLPFGWTTASSYAGCPHPLLRPLPPGIVRNPNDGSMARWPHDRFSTIGPWGFLADAPAYYTSGNIAISDRQPLGRYGRGWTALTDLYLFLVPFFSNTGQVVLDGSTLRRASDGTVVQVLASHHVSLGYSPPSITEVLGAFPKIWTYECQEAANRWWKFISLDNPLPPWDHDPIIKTPAELGIDNLPLGLDSSVVSPDGWVSVPSGTTFSRYYVYKYSETFYPYDYAPRPLPDANGYAPGATTTQVGFALSTITESFQFSFQEPDLYRIWPPLLPEPYWLPIYDVAGNYTGLAPGGFVPELLSLPIP